MAQRLRKATAEALAQQLKAGVIQRYVVQTGKDTGSYSHRYSLDDEHQALLYYNCINTHSGYKKRLIDVKHGIILEQYLS